MLFLSFLAFPNDDSELENKDVSNNTRKRRYLI
jgi:hypothetical protein